MKILALITARGGSKRLPGKNIRELGGKPLIVWSIDVVKDVPDICDILVSTDDPLIASISEKAGACIPWLRPPEFATDTASSVDVALHAIDWYEKVKGPLDGLLLLQPTSPLRRKQSVLQGIELFEQHGRQPVLGVSPVRDHPMWALKVEGDYLVPFIEGAGLQTRSQDLPLAYVVNGCFYLISPAEIRTSRSFVGEKAVPLVVHSPLEALDIDTEWDFQIAEMAVKSMHER